MKIQLVKLTKQDLPTIWQLGFTEQMPEWKLWDGPYFNDYQSFESSKEFESCDIASFFLSDRCRGIEVDGHIVGIVSRNWESEVTRWLEIGIVIYSANTWGKSIGTKALEQWVTQTFDDYPEIQRLGLTTWSGNERMMKLAQKIGMKEEGRIRKVRYWQGNYYDSMKYGVLRDEWELENGK